MKSTFEKKKKNKYNPIRIMYKLLWKYTQPIHPGLWVVNIVIQRVFRVNGKIPWMVHYTSIVNGDIEIGDNVWKSFAVSGNCYMQGNNGIRIGDDTIFGPGVKLISSNHSKDNLQKWDTCSGIVIGRRCWIGTNAVVLPGVTLGDNVIVGAGAVVTKSFDHGVIAGNPAKAIAHDE